MTLYCIWYENNGILVKGAHSIDVCVKGYDSKADVLAFNGSRIDEFWALSRDNSSIPVNYVYGQGKWTATICGIECCILNKDE